MTFVWLYVWLSNKGHLLMSFPSFFFLFCVSVCLSVKQKSFINDFLLRFGLPGVCGGEGGTPILGQYGYVPPESPPFFGLGRS